MYHPMSTLRLWFGLLKQKQRLKAIRSRFESRPQIKLSDIFGKYYYDCPQNYNNRYQQYKMGIAKPKQKSKARVSRKPKVLSKKQKNAKRVSKVQKMLEYRRKIKQSRRGKVVPIKKKRQQEADQEIIDYSGKKEDYGATDAEVNILSILGFAGNSSLAEDWENKLEQKLKEANSKSLDNPEVRRVYGEIGRIFSTYRSGKVPRAFKVIPNLQKWKEVLMITRPDNWTPQAMYQAVNIFASNFDAGRAEQFYEQFLVPAIKVDLKKNKKLNYHYYQSLKKALYKTNAWFKGIMFKFCDKNTLAREISVVESLLSKMTIPVISSSVALIKLCEMEPNTAIFHYLKALMSKSYNFPRRIVTVMTQYLLKFKNYNEELPVVWHSLFLTFCKQYGESIDEMIRPDLIALAKKHEHKLITPEIVKELA